MPIRQYNHSVLFAIALVLITALAMLGAWKLIEVVVFVAPWICIEP